MRYAFLVAWREYAENVKTKGFWIGIFIFPLLITASIYATNWIERTKPVRNFVLVDRSGRYGESVDAALERLHQREVMRAFSAHVRANRTAPAGSQELDLEQIPGDVEGLLERWNANNPELVEQFIQAGGLEFALEQARPLLRADAPEFERPRAPFRRVGLPAGVAPELPPAELVEALKPYLRGDEPITVEGEQAELFAAVIVPEDIDQHVVRPGAPPELVQKEGQCIQYWSANLADDDLKDELEQALNAELREQELLALGMDAQAVSLVQRTYLPFAELDPKKEAGEEAVSLADKIRQFAPVGFVYLLWIGIFSIAQMLLNNTIEEKSNRIIEVLLSSVTPGELMMGKLGGIAAVGLTMIAAWIGSLFGVLWWQAGPEAEVASQLLSVLRGSGLLPAFVVYFLFGYLLYSGAFLAIGSVCNTLKEAQNMMGPIIVIMIVPLMTMMFIPRDPNGTLATVLSWIPLYTPFVMMNRAAADPPLFDRVGTLIVLLVTTVLMLWLSGKIFRIGILRTGQPPKLFELVRWVRGG
jgi:ABC-2 type transport system permease protein